MKRIFLIALLAYCTPINSFWESFTLFESKKEEVISLDKKVPEDCSLKIKNKKGNISVKSWKKQKIVVEACKKGTEKVLKNALVELSLNKKTATLETTHIGNDGICNVEYIVLVPHTLKTVSVSTEKGSLKVENISGAVTAHTEKGNIDLTNINGPIKTKTEKGTISIYTKNLQSKHSILAITKKGNVSLSLPEKTSASIQATTHQGRISSEHTVTMEPRTMKINKKTVAKLNKELFCTLGSGGTELKIHTGKGNIDFLTS